MSVAVLSFALIVTHQAWVFFGPKQDDAAIEQLEEWGVGYGRHEILSPLRFNYIGNVSNVAFRGDIVDGEKMSTLVSLRECDQVKFSSCAFAERELLFRLAEMPSLKAVMFIHNSVTDDDLIELLPRLTRIRFLYIQDNPITDRSVDAIASMPALLAVMIAGTKITAAGKARLQSLRPKLQIDDTLQPAS